MRTQQALMSALDRDAGATAPASGRIGPNAAIQLIAALKARGEEAALRSIFRMADCEDWLEHPPTRMIDETAAARLHAATRRMLPPARATATLADAGTLTGDYLLANRIPRFAQTLLRLAPPRLAAALLLKAIRAHAWTFAGSGRFEARLRKGVELRIYANPVALRERTSDPVCVWHAAVMERLFRALVSPRARVRETSWCARGDVCCCFEIDWTRRCAAAVSPSQRPAQI